MEGMVGEKEEGKEGAREGGRKKKKRREGGRAETEEGKEQGVVTYMSPVEAFATGIKIQSSDQSPF